MIAVICSNLFGCQNFLDFYGFCVLDCEGLSVYMYMVNFLKFRTLKKERMP